MTPRAQAIAVEHLDVALQTGRAFWFAGDPGLGESVALEALCWAAIAWDERGMEGNPRGWIRTFVRRRLIDELRYRQSERRNGPMLGGEAVERLGRADRDRDESLDLLETLRRAADDLNPNEAYTVAATAEGALLREIGEDLGVSESRACQILRDARRRIVEAT